nr:MAG: hypothetical protein EDM05_13395 [Leptolyngbya sp. IPPAS B-1204]
MTSDIVGDSKGIIGLDGRQTVLNYTAYPFRTVGRILARWRGQDGQLYTADDTILSSSGTMVSSYHVLTAGHAFHNKDLGGFADVVEFIPGSGGRAISNRSATDTYAASNEWFGRAKAAWITTFANWSTNQDLDWDLGVLTLDRNLGNHTGWLAYGYTDTLAAGTSVTATGYPGDRFDADRNGVWDNYNMSTQTGQITKLTTHQLQSTQLDYIAGNSGGPVWLNSNQTIYGVVSHSDLNAQGLAVSNDATRITKDKFDTINSWINQDNQIRRPTDRPDLVDYDRWFETQFGRFNKLSVRSGESFSVTAYPRNNGTAPSGNFTVSFYASTDRSVTNTTGSHWLLGNANVSSLAPFNWRTVTWSGAFPAVPTGSYHIIAFFDPTNAVPEFDDSADSNQKVFAQKLTVLPTAPLSNPSPPQSTLKPGTTPSINLGSNLVVGLGSGKGGSQKGTAGTTLKALNQIRQLGQAADDSLIGSRAGVWNTIKDDWLNMAKVARGSAKADSFQLSSTAPTLIRNFRGRQGDRILVREGFDYQIDTADYGVGTRAKDTGIYQDNELIALLQDARGIRTLTANSSPRLPLNNS